MTRVGQLFEDEKIEYAKEHAKEQNVCMLVTMINDGTITEEDAAKTLKCGIDEFWQMAERK